MKTDCIEISKVSNGFVLRIFKFAHNENGAAIVVVGKDLDEIWARVKKEFKEE